ncbi:hypothetical protein ACFYKX_13810 [Cytobacillus sp. FJAT-54145]|uniref:Uncharacterized protein n=1 Tax=Cytobacillus spartinae TaxID=3299023 RepID=A0ABW6KEK6_9BACI
MEELLLKLLEGQDRTNQTLEVVLEDIQVIKSDVAGLKETVQRIELHQEETVVALLSQIKKKVEVRDSQIEVLNKRLFEVETKVEHTRQ